MRWLCIYFLAVLLIGISPRLASAQRDPDARSCNMFVVSGSPAEEIAEKIDACTRILNRGDDEPVASRVRVLSERGWAHRMAFQPDRAISDYSAAIALAPHESHLFSKRGVAWSERGFEDRAFEDFSQAIKLSPRNSSALNSRGLIFAKRGEFEKALADYTELVRADSPKLYIKQRGYINFILGRYKDAASDFSRILPQLPQDSILFIWLYLAQTRSQPMTAQEELRINALALKSSKWPNAVVQLFLGKQSPKVVSIAGRSCEGQFYLGQWLLLRGEGDAAEAALNMAAKSCPGNLLYGSGLSYVWMGAAAKADLNRLEQILQHLEGAEDRLSEAKAKRAQVLQEKLKKYARILENESGTSADKRARAFSERASDYQNNGSLDRAVADFTEAIRLDPIAAYFHKRCGAYALKGDLEDAIRDCSAGIRLSPSYKDAYRRRGVIHFVAGNYKDSVEDFGRWGELDRNNIHAAAWLYLARERIGDETAVRDLQQTVARLKLNSRQAAARLKLDRRRTAARLKLDRQRHALLEFFLYKSMPSEPLPGADPCEVHLYTGQLHMLRGQRKLAQVALEKAAAISCNTYSDEYLIAQADLTRLDAVVQDLVATEKRRTSEALSRQREKRDRITGFETLLKNHRNFLARNGAPYFEYNSTNRAWGYQNHGCLIGGEGDVYTYNVRLGPTIQFSHRVNERDYNKARDHVDNLTDQEINLVGVAADAGTSRWIVSSRKGTTTLQVYGNATGKLNDPSAAQLVESINKWCPAAARKHGSARMFQGPIKRSAGTRSSR